MLQILEGSMHTGLVTISGGMSRDLCAMLDLSTVGWFGRQPTLCCERRAAGGSMRAAALR
jgi:hypothetical protein